MFLITWDEIYDEKSHAFVPLALSQVMRQTFSLSCDQMDTFEAVLENLIMSPQSLNIVIAIYHCQTSVVIYYFNILSYGCSCHLSKNSLVVLSLF